MADSKENLASLARSYPPGARGLGVLVLREYVQIESARQRGWAWADIARAMDVETGKAKALAEAFRRVARRIAAGHLTAPGPADPARRKPLMPAPSQPAQGHAGGFKDVTPED